MAEPIIFVSFSGAPANAVADAMRKALVYVFDAHVFMSDSTVRSGEQWRSKIESHLARADFGVVICTANNRGAPWLLFEAGALGRATVDPEGGPDAPGRVCPYVVGMKFSDLDHPLNAYQARQSDKKGTEALFSDIGKAIGAKLEAVELRLAGGIDGLLEATKKARAKLKRDATTPPKKDVGLERHEKLLDVVAALSGDLAKANGRIVAIQLATSGGGYQVYRDVLTGSVVKGVYTAPPANPFAGGFDPESFEISPDAGFTPSPEGDEE